jgi:hypothetical protein
MIPPKIYRSTTQPDFEGEGGTMRKNVCRNALSGVLVSVLLCTGAWSQSTASVSGDIKDSSDAVLPGVEVSMTQTDTGLKRTAVTNETGSYTLTNLPIGPYRIEASLPGFRTYVQSGIVLQVNDNPVINAAPVDAACAVPEQHGGPKLFSPAAVRLVTGTKTALYHSARAEYVF